MPPVTAAEDYLDLIAAIEDTARRLGTPVVHRRHAAAARSSAEPFHGDARSWRDRSQPAPGARAGLSWSITRPRCTKRRGCRGSAPRSSCSTAAIPAPAAATTSSSAGPRRPTARSCAGRICCAAWSSYWHNHPSLSYLFSGLFIGPTSQHPRVDEARNDSLHELEIANAQIPDHGVTPWLVDRIFRNMLIDVTGNTHRAEFCIDKLYAPDTSSGRRGLVELRAFEMPPHARMSLTQQLLLRALIASFWSDAVPSDRSRDGAPSCTIASCCRTSSPRISTMCSTTCSVPAGRCSPSGSRRTWSSASRCTASITRRGVHVELRQALEPWHVIGEEQAAGGTARYVDSSVERLQVKVSGMTGVAAYHVVQRPARCRFIRRDDRASTWPASGIGRGSRRTACIRRSPCMRRWFSTSWTPGITARSAAACTT